MSDSLRASAEQFVSAVRIDSSLTLAAFSILYYDFALTFFSEIEYFWSPPAFSPTFFLFVASRYFGVLGPLPVLFEYFGIYPEFHSSSRRCRQLQLYHQVYAMASQALVAVLLILRTYALYNLNKKVLAILVVMHICGAVQCLTAVLTTNSPLTTDDPLDFNYSGCNLSLTTDQGVHLSLAWSAMLWFDTAIFGLTLNKAIRMRSEMTGGLLETMFRDGTVYYGILIVVNIANTLTFLLTPSNSPMKGMATSLTNVLSVTLTSRLMLNLRDPDILFRRRADAASPWETGQFSSRMMSFFHPPVNYEPDEDMIAIEEVGEDSMATSTTMSRV
ncbi:uncharacterized protein BXZ73DRAFT_95506 [Epithele typhae]|uniref:uncharacterized protein n=1 Tax=Epithele typhae TaxID=378194 RepID=UPI002007440F|nr:uncharacterized protein BXZ73DRAFT_95506 [Epithele typhae]KAH9945993.1 hypothetical protein BXZ73DRAFT_95506 [Epithele typhae]